MPGTKGNANARTHGKYSFLALGRLPKGASYVARQVSELRRELTLAVQQVHGEVSLHKAATIQAACKYDSIATLLQRWLREADSLPLSERRSILHEIGAAVESRTKAIRALGIDKAAKQGVQAMLAQIHAKRAEAAATNDRPQPNPSPEK